MKRAKGRKQLFQFPNADLKALAHLVSGGQPPGRGSAGQWKQNRNNLDPRPYSVPQAMEYIEGRCGVSAIGAKSVYLLVL